MLVIVSCQGVGEDVIWDEFTVVGKSMNVSSDLYFPELIKQNADGGYIVLDGGHESPILNFDSNFKLLSKHGVKGNGPLQIEGFRDVVPTTDQNDTTYLFDMYGSKVICYDQNMIAVDSKKLEFKGRPASINYFNDSLCLVEYRGCNTMTRLIDRRTMIELTDEVTFAPPKNEGVSIGASYDLYESFSVYDEKRENFIFFPIYSIDDVLVYDSSGDLLEVIKGPAEIIPNVLESNESLFISSQSDFRAFESPVNLCEDFIVVGYSGLFENEINTDFYTNGNQLLFFSLKENKFVAKINFEPAVYFVDGDFNCENKTLSLLGNLLNEDGKEIYTYDLTEVFRSLQAVSSLEE